MRFSLLQSSLEIPPLDNLRRAFRSVKCLTEFDAFTIARDAFGILVKHLSSQDAFTLQSALKLEGICTEIIEDSLLPELPQGKHVNRLDCLPEFLSIFDPLGRSFSLEWKHVMLILAGRVALSDFTRVVIESPLIGHGRFGKADLSKERSFSTRERLSEHFILEIFIQRAVGRYTADADNFNFQYFGERQQQDSGPNLAFLTQDLARFAPHAALNRGAYHVASLFYPSRNAFDEESIWLLWQMQKARQKEAGS